MEEHRPSGKVLRADLSEGISQYPIPIVNDIDDEDVEPQFHYVEHNVDDKVFTAEDRIGCSCIGECKKDTCECLRESTIYLYKDGRVKDSASLQSKFYDKMLYECHPDTCKCAGKCGNRMTPPKFNLYVELFKTPHAGYGVRSRQYIRAGTFIAEFVGEILDFREAYIRPQPENYSYQVANQHSEDGHYVDPTRYGNISRFFNHSCFENLLPLQYFSSHRYKKRASIGFVAFRDILPGDELTIDYGDMWWKRIVGGPNFFYCHCNWVFCINPAPDKPQCSLEETKQRAIRICRDNHVKLFENLLKTRRFVDDRQAEKS